MEASCSKSLSLIVTVNPFLYAAFLLNRSLKATKNFDLSSLVTEERDHKWYEGIIEDRSYLIKSFFDFKVIEHRVGEAYNGIVLSARMSNHNNFLKLIGCCLEFVFPVFVFEDADHGVMNEQGCVIVQGKIYSLPWSVRLKIGKEIANAVTYLHMAFPKIIIHRDVKPENIFLDKNWTAKLSDLSSSISLPEGKSRIEAEMVLGTIGYLDPSYYATSFVTEYTDVYSFGICLLVFITGKPAYCSSRNVEDILGYVKDLYENGKIDKVIDPMMAKDITGGQRLQVEECLVLALSCCVEIDEDRPKMIQVAKELKRIEMSPLRS